MGAIISQQKLTLVPQFNKCRPRWWLKPDLASLKSFLSSVVRSQNTTFGYKISFDTFLKLFPLPVPRHEYLAALENERWVPVEFGELRDETEFEYDDGNGTPGTGGSSGDGTARRRRRPKPVATIDNPHLKEAMAIFSVWDTARKGIVDSLPIVSAAIMTCRLKLKEKVNLLMEFFDMDSNGKLSQEEMSSLVKSCYIALCSLTGAVLPTPHELERWTRIIFRESDAVIDSDNMVTAEELLLFITSTPACLDLMCRFNTTDASSRYQRPLNLLDPAGEPFTARTDIGAQDSLQSPIGGKDMKSAPPTAASAVPAVPYSASTLLSSPLIAAAASMVGSPVPSVMSGTPSIGGSPMPHTPSVGGSSAATPSAFTLNRAQPLPFVHSPAPSTATAAAAPANTAPAAATDNNTAVSLAIRYSDPNSGGEAAAAAARQAFSRALVPAVVESSQPVRPGSGHHFGVRSTPPALSITTSSPGPTAPLVPVSPGGGVRRSALKSPASKATVNPFDPNNTNPLNQLPLSASQRLSKSVKFDDDKSEPASSAAPAPAAPTGPVLGPILLSHSQAAVQSPGRGPTAGGPSGGAVGGSSGLSGGVSPRTAATTGMASKVITPTTVRITQAEHKAAMTPPPPVPLVVASTAAPVRSSFSAVGLANRRVSPVKLQVSVPAATTVAAAEREAADTIAAMQAAAMARSAPAGAGVVPTAPVARALHAGFKPNFTGLFTGLPPVGGAAGGLGGSVAAAAAEKAKLKAKKHAQKQALLKRQRQQLSNAAALSAGSSSVSGAGGAGGAASAKAAIALIDDDTDSSDDSDGLGATTTAGRAAAAAAAEKAKKREEKKKAAELKEQSAVDQSHLYKRNSLAKSLKTLLMHSPWVVENPLEQARIKERKEREAYAKQQKTKERGWHVQPMGGATKKSQIAATRDPNAHTKVVTVRSPSPTTPAKLRRQSGGEKSGSVSAAAAAAVLDDDDGDDSHASFLFPSKKQLQQTAAAAAASAASPPQKGMSASASAPALSRVGQHGRSPSGTVLPPIGAAGTAANTLKLNLAAPAAAPGASIPASPAHAALIASLSKAPNPVSAGAANNNPNAGGDDANPLLGATGDVVVGSGPSGQNGKGYRPRYRRDDVLEMKRIFDVIDRDGSGTVSAQELCLEFGIPILKLSDEQQKDVTFRDFLVLLYPLATRAELSTMCQWVSYRAVTQALVDKLRVIFDEHDLDFCGIVKLGPLWDVLRRSKRLLEYGPKLPRLAPEEENLKTTFPPLLTRLFQRNHRAQLPEILGWSKPSKTLENQAKKELATLFKAFDLDGDGYLNLEELAASIQQSFPGVADIRTCDVLSQVVDLEALFNSDAVRELVESSESAAAAHENSASGDETTAQPIVTITSEEEKTTTHHAGAAASAAGGGGKLAPSSLLLVPRAPYLTAASGPADTFRSTFSEDSNLESHRQRSIPLTGNSALAIAQAAAIANGDSGGAAADARAAADRDSAMTREQLQMDLDLLSNYERRFSLHDFRKVYRNYWDQNLAFIHQRMVPRLRVTDLLREYNTPKSEHTGPTEIDPAIIAAVMNRRFD